MGAGGEGEKGQAPALGQGDGPLGVLEGGLGPASPACPLQDYSEAPTFNLTIGSTDRKSMMPPLGGAQ